jgi:hypothetical protein
MGSIFMFKSPEVVFSDDCVALVHRDSFVGKMKMPALRARKTSARAQAPASSAGSRAGEVSL